MQYTEFFSALKKDGPPRVCLVSGEENYLRDQAVSALRESLQIALPELNETILESPDLRAVIDACETLPMMDARRLVLVRGLPLLGKGKVADEAGQTEALAEWLPQAPETCCLVLLQTALDGRKKAVQALKKSALWLECGAMKDADLLKWVQRECAKRGKQIENAAYLSFVAGKDMYTLEGNLQRLCDYVGERALITRADIDALIEPTLDYSVFQITDALVAGRYAQAQKALDMLVERGENRVGLLAVLTGQMRQLFHITALMEEKKDLAVLSDNLKIHGYALTMLKKRAARIKAGTARNAYLACIETDYMIKSGQLSDSEAIFSLIHSLADAFARK